jgi:hypothetical protein
VKEHAKEESDQRGSDLIKEMNALNEVYKIDQLALKNGTETERTEKEREKQPETKETKEKRRENREESRWKKGKMHMKRERIESEKDANLKMKAIGKPISQDIDLVMHICSAARESNRYRQGAYASRPTLQPLTRLLRLKLIFNL